jgi:hypothetical protein
MMLENIIASIEISTSKSYIVPLIKFNTNLVECIVLAVTDIPESSEAYNMANHYNLSIYIGYLHRALYYKRRLWIAIIMNCIKYCEE